jgi:hypothetical protein
MSAGVTEIEIGRPSVSTVPLPLAPFHALMGVEPGNACRLLDGFDRLGVHDGGTRMRVEALPHPFGHSQRGEDAMPFPT